MSEFIEGIEREMDIRFGPGRGESERGDPAGGEPQPAVSGRIDTLYLGGGTPSKLGAPGIGRLIDAIRARWPFTADPEITIEANPEDVSPNAAATWREHGVTRVSLGVQSFDDGVLRWMHRTHDAAQAVRAAGSLREAGFEDWSMDLIFALPPEVNRSWSADLQRALELEPRHISCYGLTLEPHTPLLRWRERGHLHEADEERYEAEFLEADRVLGGAGFEHYEVSNYARDGRRARHNSAYWRRVPYVGLGPSAHGFDGLVRTWNVRDYVAWRQAIGAGQYPVAGREELTPESIALEEAYLGLRTSNGVRLSDSNRQDFGRWAREGWADVEQESARLTPAGWLRLDSLVSDLTNVRSR